jgi:hypothetical protein
VSCVPGPRYRVGILPRSSQSSCQGTGCKAELQWGFTVVVVPASPSCPAFVIVLVVVVVAMGISSRSNGAGGSR